MEMQKLGKRIKYKDITQEELFVKIVTKIILETDRWKIYAYKKKHVYTMCCCGCVF